MDQRSILHYQSGTATHQNMSLFTFYFWGLFCGYRHWMHLHIYILWQYIDPIHMLMPPCKCYLAWIYFSPLFSSLNSNWWEQLFDLRYHMGSMRYACFSCLPCLLGTKSCWGKVASAGNRTRAARVAGEHSTTEPPMRTHQAGPPLSFAGKCLPHGPCQNASHIIKCMLLNKPYAALHFLPKKLMINVDVFQYNRQHYMIYSRLILTQLADLDMWKCMPGPCPLTRAIRSPPCVRQRYHQQFLLFRLEIMCFTHIPNWEKMWQRWDSNPRLRRDWCLKPAP